MALNNTSRCSHPMPLRFKGLTVNINDLLTPQLAICPMIDGILRRQRTSDYRHDSARCKVFELFALNPATTARKGQTRGGVIYDPMTSHLSRARSRLFVPLNHRSVSHSGQWVDIIYVISRQYTTTFCATVCYHLIGEFGFTNGLFDGCIR